MYYIEAILKKDSSVFEDGKWKVTGLYLDNPQQDIFVYSNKVTFTFSTLNLFVETIDVSKLDNFYIKEVDIHV